MLTRNSVANLRRTEFFWILLTYYFQVQTQLFVIDVEYCDFRVCTFHSDGNGNGNGLHIERISKDLHFWNDCVTKADFFFRKCILPELLERWYTRPCINEKESAAGGESSSAVEPPPNNSAIVEVWTKVK